MTKRPEMNQEQALALHCLHDTNPGTPQYVKIYGVVLGLFPHLTPEFLRDKFGLDTPGAILTITSWRYVGPGTRVLPHILRMAENPNYEVPQEEKDAIRALFWRGHNAGRARKGQAPEAMPARAGQPATPRAKTPRTELSRASQVLAPRIQASDESIMYAELTTLLTTLAHRSFVAITEIAADNPGQISRAELKTLVKRAALLLRCGQDPKVFDKLVKALEELDNKS